MRSLLLVDGIAGDMPIRNNHSKPLMVTSSHGKNIKSQPHLSRLSRKELEDNFSRLQEESLLVKALSWKQEDQIKRMRTKLMRLATEGRNSEASQSSRNPKNEESIENLKDQVWQLQRHNEGLNNRLLMYKQQLQVQSSSRSPYGYVQPRINTGRRQLHTSGAQIPAKLKRGLHTRPTYTAPPTYKEHLIEEVRAEMPSELVCTSSRVQIMTNNHEKMDDLELSPKSPEKIWSKDEDYEEKSSLEHAQLATEYRASIRENVELIQVMRLLRERSTALMAAKAQLTDLQENQGILNTDHNALLSQLDELSTELKEKNNKVMNLERQVADMSILRITVREFQDRVDDLKRERKLLKDNHDRLLKNMLNSSNQPHWSADLMKERLQQKVSHLQEQLDSEVAEKRKILLQLAREQAENADLKQEVNQMLLKHKKEVELLQQKSITYSTSSQSDPDILQPPLQNYTKETQNQESNYLRDQEEERNLSWAYDQIKAAHAETTLELEKTRDMLLLQHQINKHYQDELEIVKTRADNNEREHKEEWEKLNQLLDLKNNRIQQLEAQLKDVAYGTLQFPLSLEMMPFHGEDVVDSLPLHQGENLFELHIHQACLTPLALSQAGDAQLASFCTYSFYDFEIHCTPLAVGPQPLYDFTTQYVVRTDSLFLNYLQGALSRISLHQAVAIDYNTLAAGWLSFDKVLETVEKVHGTAMLTGMNGEDFGTLDYWMRLKFPIAHCLQAYNKGQKAQAYLSANVLGVRKAQPEESRSEISKHRNELWVEIIKCCSLRSRRLGAQPSPYVIYQFFTFSDHDTPIIPASNHPYFGDQASFPVHLTLELDQYLRQTVLPIYVFDDNESELGWFLGKAQIPLLPLAQDKVIQGNFKLNDPVGEPNGSIDLKLEWKSHYLFPENSLESASQSVESYKASLSVENSNKAPLSMENYEANLHIEDYNQEPPSIENYNNANLQIEDYNESPLSVENSNKVPLSIENNEANLSVKIDNEANLSVEDYNEANPSIESYIEENLPIENYEENLPIENYDEENAFIETCDEANLLIETCDEANLLIETCDEANLLIEACDEANLLIENCDEANLLIENSNEMALFVEEFNKTPELIENYKEQPIEIPIEEENILFHQVNKWKLSGDINDAKIEPDEEDCFLEVKKQDSPSPVTAADRPSEQAEEVSETQTTDSDDAIVTPLSQKGPKTNSDKICIEIVSLAFDPEADVMSDENIQQVYVEYKFHDLPLSETETPVSLRKPRAGEDIHFHFSKVIDLNPLEHGDRRKFLFSMLQEKNPEQRQLKFIVVSDPEEQKNECQEVGYAFLELQQILNTGRDILEQEIDIVNPRDKATSIGKLKVSLQAADALQAIFKEMSEDKHL